MLQSVEKEIQKTLDQLGWESSKFTVERPRKNTFGHVSSNVAMTLAKQLRRKPLDIAGDLAKELDDKIPFLEKIEVVAPGFINFFLPRHIFNPLFPG